MKRRLLDLIVCPICKGELICTVFKEIDKEITEGILTCDCGRWFPIIDGVPRLLPDSLLTSFLTKHRDFVERYKQQTPKTTGLTNHEDYSTRLKRETSDSFGFEWNLFSKMFSEYEMNFLSYICPVEKTFFKDKLVLDAGCGMGRHTYYAGKYGAEVIGFDLSEAVEVANKNTKDFQNVHILQADIYHLPFRKELFDYIFCIGVLHHLPDPERGFRELIQLMKENSLISIWVYGRKHNFAAIYIYEPIIKVTKHIPRKILYYLCYLPAAVIEISNTIYKLLNRYPLTETIAKLVPFKAYALFPFQVKLNDCFDTFATPLSRYYTQEEIRDWFERAGLRNIEVMDRIVGGEKKGIKAFGVK